MKRFFTLILIFSTYLVTAQKESAHWYFGKLAGVDFSSGAPVVTNDGKLDTNEGCSSISTPDGRLLFYTDGITVWDSTHNEMPNGTGLGGDESSTQSALVVPQPGSPGIYYIFTTDNNGEPNGFMYSIVDMSLNGGLGDISIKNVQLLASSTEKVHAVMASDMVSYWVVGHEWGSDGFYAYRLSASGLNTTPVVSNVGAVHSNASVFYVNGQLKFSHDGKKAACAVYRMNFVEIFDFDNATGLLSNPMKISYSASQEPYGVEFSPNNSRLYISAYDSFMGLYYLDQFDMSSNDSATIVASRVNLANSSDDNAYRALQLALDGKIYVAKGFIPFLGVINDPDALGAACNYDDHGLDLIGALGEYGGLGLPGFPVNLSVVPPTADFEVDDSTACANACLNFTSLSSPDAISWQWYFDGATPSTSTAENPQGICYLNGGTFDVKLVVSNGGAMDSLLLADFITVYPAPPVPVITQRNDTLFASADPSYVAYQWYEGSDLIPNATASFYVISTNGNYNVSVTDTNGCQISVGIVLGLQGDAELQPLSLFPNPASDFLLIRGIENVTGELAVYNAIGECLFRRVVDKEPEINVNISKYASGLYYVSLLTDHGLISNTFIKQ